MATPTDPASINLSGLNNVAAGANAAASLASLIFATPIISNTQGYQPLSPVDQNGQAFFQPTPPTLIFDYEGEQTFSFESDITDHWTENNSTIQDQWALKPEVVTTKGYIGELNNVVPAPLQIFLGVTNTLVTVGAYNPKLSESALIAYDVAVAAYQTARSLVNSAVSAWSSLAGLASGSNNSSEIISGAGVFTVGTGLQNNQQAMLQQFYGYWNARVLFNVQTPWAVLSNMAIMNVKAVQDAETRMISTFEVTFKKIRTASTQIQGANPLTSGRATSQGADTTNLGTSSGSSDSTTLGSNVAAQ